MYSNTNPKDIYKIVYNMNRYIVFKYLKHVASPRFKIVCESYFKKRDKNIIIDQIKLDLEKNCTDITLFELEILSNNIYEFCCLMVHHVLPEEIGKYIIYKNNYYNSRLFKEDTKINLDDNSLKYFTKLKNKYIRIIKNTQIV